MAPLALVALMTERAGAGWSVGGLGAAIGGYLYSSLFQRWVFPLLMAGVVVLLPLSELVAPFAESNCATRAHHRRGAGRFDSADRFG